MNYFSVPLLFGLKTASYAYKTGELFAVPLIIAV